jgi:hypothetical protein
MFSPMYIISFATVVLLVHGSVEGKINLSVGDVVGPTVGYYRKTIFGNLRRKKSLFELWSLVISSWGKGWVVP